MIRFSELRDVWKGIIAFTAALVLQPFIHSLLPSLQTPNLLLCLTAALAMVYADTRTWIILGLIYALIQDVVFGMFIGIGAISILVVVLLVLLIRRFFNCRSLIIVTIVSIVITLVYAIVYWILAHAAGSPYGIADMLRSMPEQIIENTLVYLLIYWRLSVDERGRNIKNWYVQ